LAALVERLEAFWRRAWVLLGELTYRVYGVFALITTPISLGSFFTHFNAFKVFVTFWNAFTAALKLYVPKLIADVAVIMGSTVHQVVAVYNDIAQYLLNFVGLEIPDLWRDVLFISIVSIGWGVRRALVTPRSVKKLIQRQEERTRRVPKERTWAEWWQGESDYTEEPYTETVTYEVTVDNFGGVVAAGLYRFLIVALALTILFQADRYYKEEILSVIHKLPPARDVQ